MPWKSMSRAFYAFLLTVVTVNVVSCTSDGTILSGQDTDEDSVPDILDNCTLVPNGPNEVIPSQLDVDMDGYGNACDPDFDNNGVVDSNDASVLFAAFGRNDTPEIDLNGNGVVDSNDASVLFKMFGGPPGPSGVASSPSNQALVFTLPEQMSVIEGNTATAQDFTFSDPALANPGSSIQLNLTGTAVIGNALAATATISFQTLENTTVGGQEARRGRIVIVFQTSDGGIFSSGLTSYNTLDDTLIHTESNDGVICLPASSYTKYPDTLRSGDNGALRLSTCSDGSSLSQTWLAEVSDLNSSWLKIQAYGFGEQVGSPTIYHELVRHIDNNGNTKAFEWHAYDSTGSQIDLMSLATLRPIPGSSPSSQNIISSSGILITLGDLLGRPWPHSEQVMGLL